MGDTHPRTMEGTWGAGNDVSWPVECLLNGMNTSDNLIYGNGNNHNNHVASSPFRHRFQPQPQQPIHISTGLPLSSSINVSIPSHAMVEENGQDPEMNNGTSVITGDTSGQERHNVPQNHPLSTNDVLDDTEDGSDDEDEEDEVDEEMILPHRRGVPLPHAHPLDENTMVPCQQQLPVRDNLGGMMAMAENHCHPKLTPSVILRNGVAVNEHSLQPHSHQQHPHTMMPVFPQMDEFGQNESHLNQGNSDPNSGYSVYGKMYFEGRIVLHLKQGNSPDNGSMGMNGNNGMNFTSCGEAQKGQHFQGCAACRLRSPLAPENHRRHRDSHRHTIRGVLFTFEDCTIVELYPDQLPSTALNGNPNGLKPNEDTNKMSIPNGHPMPMSSYLAPSMIQQQEPGNPKQRSMQHMEIESINVPNVNGVVQPPTPAQQQQHLVKPHNQNQEQQQQQQHTSWWDEFESDADGENELRDAESTEEESNQGPNIPLPSCMNHKMNNTDNTTSTSLNHLSADQNLLHENTNDDGGDDQDQCHSDDESCSQYIKYKCNICSDEYVSRSQLDSHICLSHSLSQSHNGTNSSIPQPGIELDLSSSSHTSSSNNTSFDATNTPEEDQAVTTPTMTELENRNEMSSAGEPDDDCHSGLNIALSGEDSYPAPNPEISPVKKRTTKAVRLKHPCGNCKKIFQSKKTLKAHTKDCHSAPLEKNSFKCGKCNIEYETETELSDHNCPFLYLQSPIEMTRNRKLKSYKNKSIKKVPYAKMKKIETDSSKIRSEDEDRKDTSVTKIIGKMRKKNTTTSKLNKLDLAEGQRYKNQNHSQEILDESSAQENDNEDNSNNSSNMGNYKNDMQNEDSDDSNGSSSQDDEYEEDHNELELNSQVKTLTHSSNSNSTKLIKGKRKLNAKDNSEDVNSGICGKVKRTRRADKSSQCEKCGKRFARKDKLMRHMYVHSEEKMFVCHICEKRFSRRDKLSDHLKSHGSDEIHHCPKCKKEFLRPDILKQHVKLHEMDNKHQCPECLRFVTGKDRLEKHMARHEEAKALGQTLLCPLCTKYFIQRQSLKAHIKKFHPDSNLMELNIPALPSSPQPTVQQQSAGMNLSTLEDESDIAAVNSLNNNSATTSPTRETGNSVPGVEIYPCRQCPKQFSKRSALKKHQRRHLHDQHLSASAQDCQDIQDNENENCGQNSRQMLEDQMCATNTPTTSSPPLSHCSILLSLASQMQMATASPLSARSMSPVISNAIESTPSPAHTVIPAQHPPTPPLTHIPMNSAPHHHHIHAHHHHNHLAAAMTSGTNAPPAHIPLSLSAATVSVSQSVTAQQSNILGMNGQGLHGPSSHILQHSHHSNAHPLSHPNLSCSQGQLQANLSQHLPMSPLQHMNVGMAPQFSYYHYSYQ